MILLECGAHDEHSIQNNIKHFNWNIVGKDNYHFRYTT